MASQGAGVASGGTIDQIPRKNSSADYDTSWSTATVDYVGNMKLPGSLSVGAGPATSGAVRLTGGQHISWRNAANTSDVAGNIVGQDANLDLNHPSTVILTANWVARFTVNTTGIGFFSTSPVGQNTGWSATAGYSALKSFNPQTTTLAEVARVLGTLVDALKTYGLLAP